MICYFNIYIRAFTLFLSKYLLYEYDAFLSCYLDIIIVDVQHCCRDIGKYEVNHANTTYYVLSTYWIRILILIGNSVLSD